MTGTTIPESILKYEAEARYYDPDLDLDYIDISANAIAHALRTRLTSAEIAYQPGDGTFYGLVFVPIVGLVTAPARVVDGVTWDRHAVRGMVGADGYDRDGFIVCWIDHTTYPIKLANRGRDLAASYVDEHWTQGSHHSAGSLVLLFRAIAHYLDRYDKEFA